VGGGVGVIFFVGVTVNSKEENSLEFRPNYVPEFGLCMYCNSKILLSPADISRDGIRKRTLSLGFLGIISRVLRLEVSTLVFCLSTRCHS
jgi:hypothetical protein